MTELVYEEKLAKGEVIRYIKSSNEPKFTWWLVKNKRNRIRQEVTKFLQTVFLPTGYPNTVSPDYFEYQVWDTLQAFASSITGSLATFAVLEGVGVGDKNATPLAAAMTWLLKDGAGHIGRISFAWFKGTELDSNCKQWRLFADILNDTAICMDLFINFLPVSLRTLLLCCSNVARSIVGVAGGATRAALTQHQARANNMADVSAKDGSQETLVNLVALIVNLILLPHVTDSQWKVWLLFAMFTVMHLYANFRAVKALQMNTFNRGRLHIIMKSFLQTNNVLGVSEVNKLEPILPGRKYFLKDRVVYGSSLKSLITFGTLKKAEEALELLQSRKFLLYPMGSQVHVVLTGNCDSRTLVESYIRAVIAAVHPSYFQKSGQNLSWDLYVKNLMKQMEEVGWCLDSNFLQPDLVGQLARKT